MKDYNKINMEIKENNIKEKEKKDKILKENFKGLKELLGRIRNTYLSESCYVKKFLTEYSTKRDEESIQIIATFLEDTIELELFCDHIFEIISRNGNLMMEKDEYLDQLYESETLSFYLLLLKTFLVEEKRANGSLTSYLETIYNACMMYYDYRHNRISYDNIVGNKEEKGLSPKK